MPTLHVWSTADVALSRAHADLTHASVTGPYRFEVLEGATHWLPEQEAGRLAPLILDHVTRYAEA